MPIILKPENVLDVGADRVVDETSDESFDRAAFARRAIDLVKHGIGRKIQVLP